MKSSISRRDFIKLSAMGSMGLELASGIFKEIWDFVKKNKVGIIGLDTSHVIPFT